MSGALLMPQSIGSIIGSLVTTAFNLGTLARDIANAPAYIQRLCSDAELCRTIVLSIKALLYQIEMDGIYKDAQESIHVSTLARALVACQEVLNLLEQEVEGLMKQNMKIGNDDQVRWVWREEEIERHLKSLELRIQALNITLNILKVHQGRELKRQNAHILNCITGIAGDKSRNLLPPQEGIRNISTMALTRSQKLSAITLSTVYETEPVWELKPAGDAEPSTNTSLTSIDNINDLNESPTSASNTPTFTETSENDSFESIFLTSRVYQKKYSKSNSPLLYSNITLSELYHSGVSIFSYRCRPSLPVALLTKNQDKLNEALFEATRKQDITAISTLLEYGADMNAIADLSKRYTPWHPSEKDEPWYRKYTPLRLAVALGIIDVVRFLCIHGANVNAAGGYFASTPLFMARQADIVKLLLQHGADIEAMNNENRTALFYAADNGPPESLKALLEAGADCNKKSTRGTTPLYIAATKGNLEAVKLLLQYGADIEAMDDKKETALFHAARFGELEGVKALLEGGADCNTKNIHGEPLLHIATTYYGKPEVVKLILQYGADIESMNNQNETALFTAVRYGSYNIARILLEVGADRGKKNASGQRAVDILGPWLDFELFELLQCN